MFSDITIQLPELLCSAFCFVPPGIPTAKHRRSLSHKNRVTLEVLVALQVANQRAALLWELGM